jgi:hypothetical protein
MTKNISPHQPQIEYYYDGYICLFIGKADLKALIEMRKEHISTTNFKYYNQDARNDYYQYLECIEKFIKILLSNPNHEFAIKALKSQRDEEIKQDKIRAKMIRDFFQRD